MPADLLDLLREVPGGRPALIAATALAARVVLLQLTTVGRMFGTRLAPASRPGRLVVLAAAYVASAYALMLWLVGHSGWADLLGRVGLSGSEAGYAPLAPAIALLLIELLPSFRPVSLLRLPGGLRLAAPGLVAAASAAVAFGPPVAGWNPESAWTAFDRLVMPLAGVCLLMGGVLRIAHWGLASRAYDLPKLPELVAEVRAPIRVTKRTHRLGGRQAISAADPREVEWSEEVEELRARPSLLTARLGLRPGAVLQVWAVAAVWLLAQGGTYCPEQADRLPLLVWGGSALVAVAAYVIICCIGLCQPDRRERIEQAKSNFDDKSSEWYASRRCDVLLRSLPPKPRTDMISFRGAELTTVDIGPIVRAVAEGEGLPRNWPTLPWMGQALAQRQRLLEQTFDGCYIDRTAPGFADLPPIATVLATPTGGDMPRPSDESVRRVAERIAGADVIRGPFFRGLASPEGRAWLATLDGYVWASSSGGEKWRTCPDGVEWLGTPAGRDWAAGGGVDAGFWETFSALTGPIPDGLVTHALMWGYSPAGLAALAAQHVPNVAALRQIFSREELLAGVGAERGDLFARVLIRAGHGDWLFTKDGLDWIPTAAGKRFMESLPFNAPVAEDPVGFNQIFNRTEYVFGSPFHNWMRFRGFGQWLDAGVPRLIWIADTWVFQHCFSDDETRCKWLGSEDGRRWLRGPGRKWADSFLNAELYAGRIERVLSEPPFAAWLASPDCWWWTATHAGLKWLGMPSGQRWIAAIPTLDDDGHDTRLEAHPPSDLPPARRHQPLLDAVEFPAGRAESSHLDHGRYPEMKSCAGRQPEQVDVPCRHVLAHLARRHLETGFSQLVVQFGLDQVDLATIRSVRVLADVVEVPHLLARVDIAIDAEPREKADARLGLLGHRVRGTQAHPDDSALHRHCSPKNCSE